MSQPNTAEPNPEAAQEADPVGQPNTAEPKPEAAQEADPVGQPNTAEPKPEAAQEADPVGQPNTAEPNPGAAQEADPVGQPNTAEPKPEAAQDAPQEKIIVTAVGGTAKSGPLKGMVSTKDLTQLSEEERNQFSRRMSKINRAFVDNLFDKYDYESVKSVPVEDRELIMRFQPIVAKHLEEVVKLELLAEQRGKKAGIEEGKKAGIEEGKKAGIEEGKKAGIEEGKEEGKKAGIEEGKKAGIEEGKKLVVENLFLFRFGSLDEKLSETILSLLALSPEELTASLMELLKPSP